MAKRGYTRDTIRGGASEWDVSRPFSSFFRLLATLLVHPARFFEVLPRIPDARAPALFLVFCSLVSAPLWLVFGGLLPALAAVPIPLPASFALACLLHVGTAGGRHGFLVTWRTLAYPLGFALPLFAVPGLRWAAAAYVGLFLLTVGLMTVREVAFWRAALASAVATALCLAPYFLLAR